MTGTTLRDQLTPDHLFAEVLLHRTVYSGAIVLVEGGSDKSVLMRFLSVPSSSIIVGQGRSSVEQAIELCDARPVVGVLGIVDSDYEPNPPVSENVVETGIKDLDCLVLLEGAVVASILRSWVTDLTSIEPNVEDHANAAIEAAVGLAQPIGALRKASRDRNWGLNLRAFPVEAVVAGTVDSVDLEQLVHVALARTKNCPLDATHVLEEHEKVAQTSSTKASLCRGHDVAYALALVINKRHACALRLGRDMVERLGRMAFTHEMLVSSVLYAGIVAWEKQSGFHVLAA